MFGHFTEKAQRVIYYAQEEARAMRYPAVGTEHLLMGLLREEDSVAARALMELGVTRDKVHELISQVVTPGNTMVGNEIGITPRVKKVLQFAQEESVRWGVNYIGTEHLLLGLLREGEGIAAQVLQALDVEPDSVRKQIKALLGGTGTMDANIAGGQKGASGKQRDMLNEFGRNLNELVQQGKLDPLTFCCFSVHIYGDNIKTYLVGVFPAVLRLRFHTSTAGA